jgi:putative ABC transport system substrate-binding protein
VLGAGALGAPLQPFAQSAKIARIGFLGSASASGHESALLALRAGLLELGYVEGKNIAIAFRWAEGNYERLPDLAADLVRLKVDVIVTQGTPAALAAKRATTAIPIVMAVIGDAIAAGVVASLARPGGNITGLTFLIAELSAKRLELLKEALPHVIRVAVLLNPGNPATGSWLHAMEQTGKSLKIELQGFPVRGRDELDSAFAAMAATNVEAVTITNDGMFIANTKRIAGLAAKYRLPSIGFDAFADAGGLISYGANLPEMFRRAAYFADKILKGMKPADIPVQQPTKFELVINLQTARELGLAISPSLLRRADVVIE